MSRFITPKDVGQEKFDAAIYGVWKGENYGGIATCYALYRCITSLGLSAVLISPEMKQEGLNTYLCLVAIFNIYLTYFAIYYIIDNVNFNN